MSSFTLKLNTDNAAFSYDAAMEVARILREAANKLESGFTDTKLRDYNGNVVGQFTLDIDE